MSEQALKIKPQEDDTMTEYDVSSGKALSPHLQALEDESIFMIREALSAAENPTLLYSIGKDSAVLLHLVMKAYYPVKPPLRLLHVDTRWKFKEMISFVQKFAEKTGLDLIVHTNPDGIRDDISPDQRWQPCSYPYYENRSFETGSEQRKIRCDLYWCTS